MSDARHRSPGTGELGGALRRGEKIAIAGGEWRFGEPAPDAQTASPGAHESLVSRETVAESLLTAVSVCKLLTETYRSLFRTLFCPQILLKTLFHRGKAGVSPIVGSDRVVAHS